MMETDDGSAEDFDRALEAARSVQREQPGATPFYCAERAVKEVFGRRLGLVGDTVPPAVTPLYYRLVTRIEAALSG